MSQEEYKDFLRKVIAEDNVSFTCRMPCETVPWDAFFGKGTEEYVLEYWHDGEKQSHKILLESEYVLDEGGNLLYITVTPETLLELMNQLE